MLRAGSRLGGVLVGLALIGIVTASLVPIRGGISRATPALLFVVPVVAAAVVGRRVAAVATAVAALFVFQFAFVPPYDHVAVATSEDLAALAVFMVVAVVTGTLVAVEADRRQAAEERTEQIRRLVAERERLQEEVNRVAVMERIDEQRSALLRSVSHDLRTPLATIRAVASDLRDGADYPAETRDRLLDLVGDEAERLNRIVENLLSLSRIEAGAFRPDRQAVAIDELVADRVRQLSRLLRDVQVDVELDAGLPLVDADYSQLDQVITNLLENAARHSPPGSRIHVFAQPVGPMMNVAVADEGDGVPPQEREHIFEPFRRGRGSTSSGVGLAICKAIVDAHGGAIGVTTPESGAGARFWFTVPLVR